MDYYKLKVLNNKRKIITCLVILLLIGFLIFYYLNYNTEKDSEIELFKENDRELSNNQIIDDLIWVDIKGYVLKEGVYSFQRSENARVNDLILKAGGLKKEADTSLINLSKKLEDEMTVIIYSQKEVNNYVNMQNTLAQKLEICELKLQNNACINKEVNNNKEDKININTASKEELMKLSGIGESKAKAIIEYRSKNVFKDIKDILNVDGIGETLFESIKENIRI